MFNLSTKTAVVTGAGSGIGASIAQALAGAGAYVYLADRDPAGAANTKTEIEAAGGECAVMELNVTSEEDWNKAVQCLVTERGTLHILVNNAGIGHVGTMLTTSGDDLDRLYSVNVRGVFNGCRAFLPHLIEKGGGSIINMASVGGVVGISDRLAYCTTKFAVVGLTKSMALDHAKTGVRVNCICPGRVETPFVTAWLKKYPDPEKAYNEAAATQAVGRMGRPDEIAAAALYLASDEAAFVTGSALMIDGGFSTGK